MQIHVDISKAVASTPSAYDLRIACALLAVEWRKKFPDVEMPLKATVTESEHATTLSLALDEDPVRVS